MPAASHPMLRCHDLTRAPWFEGVTFEVAPGRVGFVRGPTGSGKTLLLRAIADLDAVDSGGVELAGRSRDDVEPNVWRRRVLYLHQSAPRLPGTVLDNVLRIAALGSRAARGDAARKAPDECAATVRELGLDPDADAERLSGGEAQLLAFARAFVTRPDVFLLDEATSAMDGSTAARLETRLAREWERGASALWVTHDDDLEQRLGDVVVRLGETREP